ncbi:MAG: hypothetical protein GQ558_09270, partial [Thermoplasmata archaeon]|nr:hypothetical protein [Thermoplasmata archaeon]
MAEALMWVALVALVIYGAASVLASIRVVPEGKVGIVSDRSGRRRVIAKGVHLVFP